MKTCVVCGASSHRTDWVNKMGDYVACDSHSRVEMGDAVKKAMAPPSAVPVAKTTVAIPKS
jgi:hypothetical protein